MNKKSYWIWHYGEYEIYHIMNLHLRREERGMMRPAFWKIAVPYATVKFRNTFCCEEGYLKVISTGTGYLDIDGVRFQIGARVELPAGEHDITVQICCKDSFPAIFVESDVCCSDSSWESDYFVGKFQPVGCNEYFDSPEKRPDVFPFSYEDRQPVSQRKIGDGTLFDFGTELFGFLNINGADPEEELYVFYGESEEEALDVDFTYITDEVSGQTSYCLRQRAFRYVYIINAGKELTVSAKYEYLPLVQKGKFTCDNQMFNDLYATAAYTFHLNCREAFLDGIKRDRWVWSGDAYQSARINAYLFADKQIEQRTAIGLIGKKPIEQHINTIVDYSLLWIIGLQEHYMIYGDEAFLRRIFPTALEMMAFCETRLDPDGFIQGIDDDWTFIDWSEIDKTGAVCAEQMLLIAAYEALGKIATALSLDAAVFSGKAEDLKKRVNAFYWDQNQGAFIDSFSSGKKHVTRHANIFAVMYDIATEEQKQSILENVLKNDNITKITTPYFEGYELDVLAKMGEFSHIEDMLTSYWGGMLKLGAKTIWEEYDPAMSGSEHYAMYGGKYEKSLCHAWGAGPIYLFGRYYLGVYPTSAGFETFCVAPNLGGLKEMKGTVPVNGETVSVELDENRLFVVATKPGGTLLWQGKEYPLIPNEPLVIANH